MHIPTEPAWFRADADDTKIPDPIITPKIMLTAEKSPISLLSWTALAPFPFSVGPFWSPLVIFSLTVIFVHLTKLDTFHSSQSANITFCASCTLREKLLCF
uniref:Uncharacterized protein n=1 Tax=Photinus pyralis TaxID=7054 RepID=A0A1Y1L8E6_PHOPY